MMKIIVPELETPLVHFVHDAQQGRQDWENELPPRTMSCLSKQEKGSRK